MDQRTADSLFGTGDDNNVDFFAQSSATPSTQDAFTAEQVVEQPVEYTPDVTQHEYKTQEVVDDPYSQLRRTSTLRAQNTAPSTARADPYAATANAYQPRNYAPPMTNSPPSTYGVPPSHASQPDPYASIGPRAAAPKSSTYTPAPRAPQQSYSPNPPYAPPVANYSQPIIPDIPKPPIPTSSDVSKYRSAPNAYDPPIRNSPVTKPPPRHAKPNGPAFSHNANGTSHIQGPPFSNPHAQGPPFGTHHTQGSPFSTPPVNQFVAVSQPPPFPHSGHNVVPPVNGPPFNHGPSISQVRQATVMATPPPRVVSPYAYNAPAVRATPPPPRPPSTASNPPHNVYQRQPSLPSVGSDRGPHSRPQSAASLNRQATTSPQTLPAVGEAPVALDETTGSDASSFFYNSLGIEDDPTPTIANSVPATDYIGGSKEADHKASEPNNSFFSNESHGEIRNDVQPGAPEDPYGAVHPPDGFHATRNPNVVSPPRSVASPPNVSAVTPPPPKSIPPPPRANSYTAANPAFTQSPPKADPYAPKQANPVPPPPPAASSIPLSDPYATTAPPAHAISTLAPPSSANIVDLSHSPPTQRQPISKYNPQKYAHNTNGGPNAFGSANSNPPVRAGSFGGTLPPPPPLPPTTLVSNSDAFGKAQYIAAPSQAAPTNYAPSPSLLGTNDPLGRAAVRVPILSFGFGGRIVACFHNNPGMGAFDGMAPVKPSTSLTVKLLKDVIAPSAYDVTDGGFPGPLFNDQGPGGATSVLQTAGAALKAKKTALIQWLEGRITEIEGGLMYIGTTGPIGGGTAKAEGKVVLMKLLKIWVENDGKLSGSPAIEEAIRTALLGPRSDVSSSVGETSALGYQYALGNGPTSFYTGDGQGMSKPDAVTATYQTKTSSLDKIQEHLLHGERKKAYQLALDERLWAHALLIARGLDEESWTEAAHEFIKIELSSQGVGYDPQQPFSSDGRESLRVAYGLFAGDGPSALKLLVPPARFGVNSLQSHSRVSSSHASISPDAPTTEATSVPEETWAQWRKLLAATIANQSPNNTAATTALGDYLLANNWVEAAHCCYLLALSTSPFSGASAPGVRIVLLGAANPLFSSSFRTDVQTILLSEVAEFAMSLLPTGKGAESFHGSPHLQAYRLWHAICLAEMGDITLATRYTDAINATIKSVTRGSPFFTHTFFQQLEYLQDRLVEAPHAEKAKAWLSKPSVRSFNDWFTGGLEKLIQGDETPHNEESSQSKKSLEIASNIGPFSHYSSISSATPSAIPSPSPSFTNLHSASASIGRAESAAGHRPPATHHSTLPLPPPPPRAASAVDFSKTKPPPAPKPSSAGAAITSFPNRYQPPPNQTPPTSAGLDAGDAPRPLYAQWWSDSNDNDGVTPTATTFRSPGADGDTGSFVSLMDSEPTLMPSASYGSTASVNRQTDFDEDEEDLGFGNSKKPKKSESSGDTPEDQSKQSPNQSSSDTKATTTDTKTELAAAAAPAKGWFGWLRRGEATPKPIVAKLGEESAFYFDKDLGKWVNKKAGAEPAAPKAPPPPPSRSQTVSPGRGGAGINTATPPPPRAASVAQMHVSGLAPPSRPSSALSSTSNESPGSFSDSAPPSRASPAPPPRSFGQTPPPPTGSPAGSVSGRPAKKNARSRYVDVFQTS